MAVRSMRPPLAVWMAIATHSDLPLCVSIKLSAAPSSSTSTGSSSVRYGGARGPPSGLAVTVCSGRADCGHHVTHQKAVVA
jgi:hypothetical protein